MISTFYDFNIQNINKLVRSKKQIKTLSAIYCIIKTFSENHQNFFFLFQGQHIYTSLQYSCHLVRPTLFSQAWHVKLKQELLNIQHSTKHAKILKVMTTLKPFLILSTDTILYFSIYWGGAAPLVSRQVGFFGNFYSLFSCFPLW